MCADDLESISPVIDFDAQAPFDLAQMFIQWPAKICQAFVINGFQYQFRGQGLCSLNGATQELLTDSVGKGM